MHVSGHVSKRSGDLRILRIAYIKDERPAGVMIVGEKHATGGHGVLRVMDPFGLLIGGHGRYETAIGRRGRVCINYCEEVIALVSRVTSPDKQIVLRARGLLVFRLRRNIHSTQDESESGQQACHKTSIINKSIHQLNKKHTELNTWENDTALRLVFSFFVLVADLAVFVGFKEKYLT